MKRLIVLLVVVAMAPAKAAVFTWPGPAPCDGTLDACIENAGVGDTVQIASDTVEQNAFIRNQSVTLEAASGFRAEFQDDSGVSLRFNDGNDHSVTVRGLRFRNGTLSVSHTDGVGAVHLERNRFDGGDNSGAAISISSNSDINGADFEYTVLHNTIHSGNVFTGAVRYIGQGFGSRSQFGVVEGNVITLAGDDAAGISVRRNNGIGIYQTRIFGNTVESATREGISIINSADLGGISAYVYSNLIYSRDSTDRVGSGIRINAFSSSISAIVVNNTLVGHILGLQLLAHAPDSLPATVANNIIARNQIAWNIQDEVTLSERHNLFHDNDVEPDSIDATSLMADPLFHPNLPGRLLPASPAIDAGDNVATSTFPGIDALGNARYLNGTTDIGAVEYGDHWLTAIKKTTTSNNFPVDSPLLNNQPGQHPQVTQIWNPYGRAGVYNDANEGIYYSSGFWRIFNESTADTMPEGAAFTVFAPGSSLLAFSHSNTAASSSTAIDQGATNNQPERLLSVTQHWNRAGGGVYNDHPIGVVYASGKWRIINLDLANIPIGADFNVYAQPVSYNAYEHIASAGNTDGHITILSHPLLDGNPCARLQVTQSASEGVLNANAIGVYYAGPQWTVFNQNFANLPEGAAFHIIIDPNSSTCKLFSDRFEDGRF